MFQEQQIEAHDAKVKQLEKEMQEHHAYKPTGKHAKHGSLQVRLDWDAVEIHSTV